MYRKLNFDGGFVPLERETLDFWKDEEIIEQSFARNPEGEYFTFYDGPPTANGKPHIGHVLTRSIKDLIPRYKSMRGYKVLRKAGWDTHGLPVELEIEKKLDITGKSDIEKYGVENFIKECKESVFSYVSLWREMSDKVGFWVDMDHPYVTYENNYIESVWWALRQLWDKDLVYKGHKVMPYCPRCGTSLSSHEVAQGYKDIQDVTAFAKFKAKDEEDAYFLAWTTTPWTLPSNIALGVNKNIMYCAVKQNDETYYLAKNLLSILEGDHEYIRDVPGEELLDRPYEQLLPFVQPDGDAFRIIHGDFITTTEGTGIVHMAPAYGEDDNIVIKANGMGSLHLVKEDGTFVDAVTPWAGMNVRTANPKIVEYLRKENRLYKSVQHLHSYPHCWRCDTPLLYYPKNSWFIRSTAYRDALVANNQTIHWLPEHIKDGRMGNFLDNVVDWAISRDRYWGTPLPIWECECGHREMIGSIEELKEKSPDCPEDIELHKPYIDGVHVTCPQCGKSMTRVTEVIDCWLDSGSMPFAQFHYPFENKELFENNFPAQFISEAIDQTRGWFYTLLNLSTAIFGKASYENCIVMGHVLDSKGVKMSKSKGNAIEPNEILDTVGADATRWHFYVASSPWVSKRLSISDVQETQRKFMLTLSNTYSFYVLYADLDNFNPLDYSDFTPTHVMDRWILSKLNSTIAEVEKQLDAYQITPAAQALGDFVDELSNWYVRRNRARFWQSELNDDKIGAYTTLYKVLTTLSVTLAPFIPFFADEMYRSLVKSLDKTAPESVHLCDWISSDSTQIDPALESEMALASHIVKLGRSARNGSGIKNRQPLQSMLVSLNTLPEYYTDIIKDELNIKEITYGADLSTYAHFDVKPNLPILGKAYGRYIPQIKAELAKHDPMELSQSISGGKSILFTVDETEIELNADNLLITMSGREGFAFSGDGAVSVVLDTTLTPALIEEGTVRELLSKIQNMRKESGYEVADHIFLHFSGNSELEALIKKNEAVISKETLADAVLYNDGFDTTEVKINGQTIGIGTDRI